MIVLDTSALMAIVLGEGIADDCAACLAAHEIWVISAATYAETLIAARRRGVFDQIAELIDVGRVEIDPVTPEVARRVEAAYLRWGKGRHPASLNFGDCFSFELATRRSNPLLYVGNDFALTDVRPALPM
jgi:ribonuclease VapC